MLSADQIRTFAEDGFLVVSGDVVSDAFDVLEGVDQEIDRLVAEAPPPEGHVGHHFYWQTRDECPALFRPLHGDRGVLALARELVGDGVDVAFDQVQVALNVPPYAHRPGRPHIDGNAPDQETPGTFTLLAALLLTDELVDNGGNLWVWPGSHLSHGAFFADRGPRAFNEAGGYPDIELPEPTQVRGRRGDVLLAHYLLGHNIGGNYETDRTRRTIYWRLRAPGHAARWQQCLADPWLEYPRVRRRHEPR